MVSAFAFVRSRSASVSDAPDGSFRNAPKLPIRIEVTKAENGVEAGLLDVWGRLSTGRLVFRSLQGWLAECRLYRRNAHRRPVRRDKCPTALG